LPILGLLTTRVVGTIIYIWLGLSVSVFRDNPKIPEDGCNKFLWSFDKRLHSYTMRTPSDGINIEDGFSRKIKVTGNNVLFKLSLQNFLPGRIW